MEGSHKGLVVAMAIMAAFFAYNFCKIVFRVSPFDSLLLFIKIIFGNTVEGITKLNSSMSSRTLRMSREERRKSWRFKYQQLLNDILLDLGWKQAGVTINGLTILVFTISTIISALGYMTSSSIVMTFMLFICAYVLIVVVLFSVSRERHRQRKIILIQAEDMLCASISNGLINAIKMNVNNIDPEIRDDFKMFLQEVDCG